MIHRFFTISCILLLVLIVFGAHKRIRAPQMYPFIFDLL